VEEEVHQLIAGIDAHICDKCIEQAHGIVLEETKSGDSSKLLGSYFKETKRNQAFLDQYVIGQDQTKSNVSCSLQSLQTFDAATRR
jgi:ATP-dependent Clp protease ATP-binding subunit ClpX